LFNSSSLGLACERGGFVKAVLERSPPTAVWYFRASFRILHNQDPTQPEGERLPVALALRARWTDMKEIVMPRQSEELTMIATKP